jgi:hypothetical protein
VVICSRKCAVWFFVDTFEVMVVAGTRRLVSPVECYVSVVDLLSVLVLNEMHRRE